MYMTIAVHYVRPKQLSYVREALQAVIREVVDQEDLDLETDPVVVSSDKFASPMELTRYRFTVRALTLRR